MNTGYRLSRNDQERNTEMMTYSVGFQLMAHMAQEMSNPFSYQFPQFLYPMGEQDSRRGRSSPRIVASEKEGCDLTVSEVLEECKVPVIAEIGPYYDDGDVDALTPANRLGRFLIENYVQHGYGVAQVSVFGTGQSNHCMDLMGHDEQAGIKVGGLARVPTLVQWESWRNRKVVRWKHTMERAKIRIGLSATIVPMSGLIGVHDRCGEMAVWRPEAQ